MNRLIVIIPAPYVPRGTSGALDPMSSVIAATISVVLIAAFLLAFALMFVAFNPQYDGNRDGRNAVLYGSKPEGDHYVGARRRIYVWAYERGRARELLNKSRHVDH